MRWLRLLVQVEEILLRFALFPVFIIGNRRLWDGEGGSPFRAVPQSPLGSEHRLSILPGAVSSLWKA